MEWKALGDYSNQTHNSSFLLSERPLVTILTRHVILVFYGVKGPWWQIHTHDWFIKCYISWWNGHRSMSYSTFLFDDQNCTWLSLKRINHAALVYHALVKAILLLFKSYNQFYLLLKSERYIASQIASNYLALTGVN